MFGDGDGTVFDRFTKPVDVLGHELSHAVTQFTANLTYQGQSGALNESISDVFGSCLKQRLLGQTADQADWLIGEGIFLPSVQGRALRSMAEPGTAYDDPTLGKDPQVATMADYVDTQDDNGGVHTNSGIPNKAFHLAATGIGGTSWDGAGTIWYAALTSGISADTDFAGFAAATVTAAEAVSPEAAEVVRSAWEQVGVTGAAGSSSGATTPATGRVAVTRTGGFAGVRQSGELTLGDDPRTDEVSSLLQQDRPAGGDDVAAPARPVRLHLRRRRASRSSSASRTSPPTSAGWPGCCSTRTRRRRPGAPCAGRPGRAAGSPARRCSRARAGSPSR